MATNAERQARFRALMKEKGLVPVTVYLPHGAALDLVELVQQLQANPHLTFGSLRDPETGKLVGRKRKA